MGTCGIKGGVCAGRFCTSSPRLELTLELRLALSARKLGIVPHGLAAIVFVCLFGQGVKCRMPIGQSTAAGKEQTQGVGALLAPARTTQEKKVRTELLDEKMFIEFLGVRSRLTWGDDGGKSDQQ